MNIAYVTPEYPHDRLDPCGGLGTSVENLATALVELGHEVTLFIYGQRENDVFTDHGINIHLIAQKQYAIGGFYLYRKHIERYIHKNSEGIDILEAPDWTGFTAFMNLKIPLVIRFHGSDTYFCSIEKRPQKFKNRFFEQQAVKRAKAFIAPTHFAGYKSMELFELSNKKLQIIPHGLNSAKFENEDIEAFDPLTLLNIGTLIRKKGVFQLVAIFNKLVEEFPQARLIFIGSDSPDVQSGNPSTWKMLQEQLTDHAKERTSYLGKIPYGQVQQHIKNAHVCVFPSLAETLGMVTIESMALGKAVVNTNIGWAQDIMVHGVDGYMHHPDDITDYVKTITMLFSDLKEVHRIAKNAQRSSREKFDINLLAQQNINFYQTVLDL